MPRPSRAGFPPPSLIATTDALQALCHRLATEEFVTVDTEFMRERTYWPELCVVQLAGAHEVAVIDAQAPDLDLAPLGALLADQAVMKVFHAARQDIEIFVLRFGDVPRPLFDTQIAAMVAGFGEQVGYDALVAALTGGSIDKAHRFSDWSARPLSAAQIAYAAADVTYLRDVYTRLLRAAGAGRPAGLGGRGNGRTRRPRQIPPRSGCDVGTAAAAQQQPPLPRHGARARGLARARGAAREHPAPAPAARRDPAGDRRHGARRCRRRSPAPAASAAASPKAAPAPRCSPPSPRPRRCRTKHCPRPRAARDGARPSPALVSLLKVLLAAKCEDHHVAARLVASSDDIDRLATEEAPDIAGAAWLATRGVRRGRAGAEARTRRPRRRRPAGEADFGPVTPLALCDHNDVASLARRNLVLRAA